MIRITSGVTFYQQIVCEHDREFAGANKEE